MVGYWHLILWESFAFGPAACLVYFHLSNQFKKIMSIYIYFFIFSPENSKAGFDIILLSSMNKFWKIQDSALLQQKEKCRICFSWKCSPLFVLWVQKCIRFVGSWIFCSSFTKCMVKMEIETILKSKNERGSKLRFMWWPKCLKFTWEIIVSMSIYKVLNLQWQSQFP